MRRRFEVELACSRKSQMVPMQSLPRGDTRFDYYASLYPSMFLEDVANEVLPYSRKKLMNLVISDDSKRELILQGLTNSDQYGDYLFRLWQLINQIVKGLIIQGFSPYEIVYWSDKDGKVQKIGLEWINPLSAKVKRDGIVQYIPSSLWRESGYPRTCKIGLEDVILFRMPNYRMVKRVLRSLKLMSDTTLPWFKLEKDMQDFSNRFFDFEHFRKLQQLYFLKITKDIGWDGRDVRTDSILEYYKIEKYLRFHEFALAIRKCILDGFNSALKRIGDRLEVSARLEVTGLPDASLIESLRRDLRNGVGSIKQIYDRLTAL